MDHWVKASGEASGEGSGETSPDGRWLTYDELGRIRGIGRESAVKLVQRKRWRRMPGNDGIARVLVPLDWLVPAKEPSGEASGERSPEPSPNVDRAIATFEIALAALRQAKDGEIATLRTECDRAVTTADLERSRAERAEQALAGERRRADMLRDRCDQLRGDLETAQRQALEAAQTLRQADASRRRGAASTAFWRHGMASSRRTPPTRRVRAVGSLRQEAADPDVVSEMVMKLESLVRAWSERAARPQGEWRHRHSGRVWPGCRCCAHGWSGSHRRPEGRVEARRLSGMGAHAT